MLDTSEELKKAAGERIRHLRREAGYRSAEDLAEAIGVNPTSVYEIERGLNWISPDMAAKLSPALRVSVPELYGNHPGAERAERLIKLISRLSHASPTTLRSVEDVLDGADQARKPLSQSAPKAAK